MHTKDFVIDNCSKCKSVKYLSATSPYIETAVLSDALVIKSIDLSNDSGLVISSQKSDSVFVSHFEGQ